MPRKDPPQPLSTQTNPGNASNNIGHGPQSATELTSPTSPRTLFSRSHSKSSENIQSYTKGSGNVPQMPYPENTLMPKGMEGEMSRQELPKVNTPPAAEHSPHKSGFFGGFGKSKPSNKLQQKDDKRPATRDQLQSRGDNEFQDMSSDNRPRGGAPLPSDNTSETTVPFPSYKEGSSYKEASSESGSVQNSLASNVTQKKNKSRGLNLLRRTNSTRNEFETGDHDNSRVPLTQPMSQEQEYQEGVRTAPLREEQDPNFREALTESQNRNHSADRQRRDKPEQQFGKRLKDAHRPNQGSVSLPREGASSLMNHLKGAGSKAQGLFGRSKKRDDPVEAFVPKIVNQPLIEQTRNTRISKRLETSRDKTEFWMPALPWRCIDYLNYRGTDQEGLYRVPGGGVEIKKYHKKFDDEHDVDLFQERDLYDINIIGSLLKQWLRELPDEILPKEAQIRVARASGPEPDKVPQVLVDELSNLPPYNYYLLFALTCHLSLILEHEDKNKMSMHNLTVCLLPCMKMDAICFKLLVEHWRDCWKGCLTESEWMEKENKWREGEAADLRAPGPLGMRKGSVAQGSTHERNLSNNSDSRPATAKTASNERSRNASRENNPINMDTRQGSNGKERSNGDNNNNERTNGGNNNSQNTSNSSSREREQRERQPQQSQPRMGLRGGALESEPAMARLQTPPEIYVPVGGNGRHDQLLDPIQPMSPMHMGSARQA